MSTNSILNGFALGTMTANSESFGFSNGYKKAQMEFRHQSSQIYQNGYTQGYTQGCLELKRQLLPAIAQQQSTIAQLQSTTAQQQSTIEQLQSTIEQLQSIIAQQKNIIEYQKKYSELLEFKYCEKKKQK